MNKRENAFRHVTATLGHCQLGAFPRPAAGDQIRRVQAVRLINDRLDLAEPLAAIFGDKCRSFDAEYGHSLSPKPLTESSTVSHLSEWPLQ